MPGSATRARTAKAKERFLASFTKHGIVSSACIDAEVGRQTFYDWRKRDQTFEAAYLDAEETAADVIERELVRRGMEGWDEPQFRNSGQVGAVTKYSDACLLALAKARRPEKYRERYELTGKMTVSSDEAADILNEGRQRARAAALASSCQP